MIRLRSPLLIVLFATVLTLSGCGGDGDDEPASDSGDAAEEDIDGTAIEALMPDFAAAVESEFGFFSEPIFDEGSQTLIGLQPIGVDAVVFCDRLSEFLAGEGFEDVPISVRFNAQSEELAAGVSGGTCEAAS
jgi:hypothetical protein